MKTKRICKSTVSLLLAFMMLVSMLTVGIVSTSAAETDTATTGADTTLVYFTRPSAWTSNPSIHYWGGSTESTWPGKSMTWVVNNSYGQGIYKAEIPADTTKIIFNNTNSPQTVDITLSTYNHVSGLGYYLDSTTNSDGKYTVGGTYDTYVVSNPTTATETTTTATEAPTTGDDTSSEITVFLGIISHRNDSKAYVEYWCEDGEVITVTATQLYETNGNAKTFMYHLDDSRFPNWTADSQFYVQAIRVPSDIQGLRYIVPYDNSTEITNDVDMTVYDSDEIVLVYEYNSIEYAEIYYYMEVTGEEELPDDPFEDEEEEEPTETSTIYFRDDYKYANSFAANDDADIYVSSNGNVAKMTETIDTKSGNKLWYVENFEAGTSVTFYRANIYQDETTVASNNWGTWSGTRTTTQDLFCISDTSTSGYWTDTTTNPCAKPSGTADDYWFGIWVDTKADGNTESFIKWHEIGDESYNLYLPSYVDASHLTVYTSFTDLSIDGGTAFSAGTANTVDLSAGSHTIKFLQTSADTTEKTWTLNVYQTKNTAAMLLNTANPLFTGTTANLINDSYDENDYKEAISTKGTYYMYGEDGSQVNSDTGLKKLKGRGNSTFEASMKLYGKYAYNITLDSKAQLIDGATKSKKWCLLANNVDHTMMRNTLIYEMADLIGLDYGPETRLVDLYDNGNYFGSYVITEKVEYGGENTLMGDLNNLDDANEDANPDVDLEALTAKTGTYNGYTYQYREFTTPSNYTECNFLLEHELYNRYKAEASWFVSPRTNQAVVVKYPEYANQEEMQWIIDQYEAMEAAVYNNDYATYSTLIDVESFAKVYLLQELTLNLDAGATSYFMYNDLNNGGKLTAAPVWDYDWSMGAYAYANFGEGKYTYNGSSYNSTLVNVANPEQWFVKVKGLKTGPNDTTHDSANYNLQAKLAQNTSFWAECKDIWTNTVKWVLDDYVDNDAQTATDSGLLVTEMLAQFESSVEMNEARWDAYDGIKADGNIRDNWGTKITCNYEYGSYNFRIDSNYTSYTENTEHTRNYANTVYFLNDWLAKRSAYMDAELYDESLLTYTIVDADFDGAQTDDQLKVTPTATVIYKNKELSTSEYNYTVYLNGNAVANYPFSNPTATITLANGTNNVYVVVTIPADADVSATTVTRQYTYEPDAEMVTFTVKFKSSTSYRYIPYISVNGADRQTMTETSDSLGYNEANTQEYIWYTFDVTASNDTDVVLKFTNRYSMNASITLTAGTFAQGSAYCFGVDNLNKGTTVVDLTDKAEYIQNFKKSATHMVANDSEAEGLATTAIDGTVYTLGDATGDDSLNIMDATAIQLALVEKNELSDTATALADYDLSGNTSIMDVTEIQTYLAN